MIDTKDYWDKREKEIEEQVLIDTEIAQSKSAQLRRAQRAFARYAMSSHPREQEIAAEAEAEIAALEAEIAAEAEAEWDIETTRHRKEAWNAAVKAATGKVIVRKIEKECGFLMQDLKKHLTRHGLA